MSARGPAQAPAPPSEPGHAPRQASREVSFGVRVAAWWSLCFLLIVAALYVLIWLLNSIALVTVTVSVGVMVTALLRPPVRWLVRLGVPRALAAVGVFLVGIAALVGLTWFVGSQIAANAGDLQGELQRAGDDIKDWLITGPAGLSAADVDQYATQIGDAVTGSQQDIAAGFVQTAGSAVGVLSGFVLGLFAVLFLMLDDGTIWRWFVRILPRHSQPHALQGGDVAWATLERYMQSLVLLAAINALAMAPVLILAGVPLVVPLVVLLFLGSLIPLVGVLVAGVVVALIALVSQGIGTAVVVIVALILIVQLFGNLLNPIILGKMVDIHPLAILVGVTGGTILGGVFGAFVAVPLVAVVKNVINAVREHHRGGLDDAESPGAVDGTDRAAETAASASGGDAQAVN
ncbi:AI-2E family transporter [Dermacoccaceae bacterium W4C1]